MLFGGFFENKIVLVTGIAGVKGTWLGLELLRAGAEVWGIDIQDPSGAEHFLSSGLVSATRFVQGDVTDIALVQRLVDDVDAVFHLAAVSLVGQALRDPLEAYRTNLMGTVTLLEAFRRSRRARYAVIVTTDKVYRPGGRRPWVETDPLFAPGPYPVSKACAEHVVSDYHHTYLEPLGKRLGVGRAGNVIAGGDFHSSRATGGGGRLFVDCFEALMEGRSPLVFNPGGRRAYLHGLDVVTGYMMLMSRLDLPGVQGEAFNFGPVEVDGTANGDLASRICALWGDGLGWEQGEGREEPFSSQALCWEKARKRLGWHPVYSVGDALAETAAWYRTWQALRRSSSPGFMRDFDLEQVRRHRERAALAGASWAVDA